MPTIQGVVSTVNAKNRSTPYGEKTATSFQVDGEWYSGGFKKWEVDEGDEVALTFKTNPKGYKDVTGIAVLSKGTPRAPANTGTPRIGKSFPVDPLAPERTINRQNALTNATTFCVAFSQDNPERVIEIARIFEAYTTGDSDREWAMEEAERIMSED